MGAREIEILGIVNVLLSLLERALHFIRDDAPEDVKNFRVDVEKLKEWRDREISAQWEIVKHGDG